MRPEKEAIAKQFEATVQESGYVLLADHRGLTVEEFSELRNVLGEQGSTITVAKNSMLKQALKALNMDGLDPFLTGPTSMITGTGEVTEVARRLRAFARDHQKPGVKGGCLGATVFTAGQVAELADIPPREIMLGRFVGVLAAPMSGLAGVLTQKLLSLLYVLKAVEDKKAEPGLETGDQ